VSNAAQSSNVVAARYVGALIDLASDAKKLNDVEKDFADLGGMVASSVDLQNLIRSPRVSAAKQDAAIEAIAKKARFVGLTTNFLKTLVHNRRLNILESVLDVFKEQVAKRRGEIIVTVETAQDLTAAQMKSLQATLKKETGADIALNARVSPEILGGMIVTVGSHMIDDSVRRKLDKLKTSMSGANENTNLKEVS